MIITPCCRHYAAEYIVFIFAFHVIAYAAAAADDQEAHEAP